MLNQTNIIHWDRKYRDDFIRLNCEWIERYFRLEPTDWKVLSDPEGVIIQRGGQIWKLGFKEVTMEHPVYERCDLCMAYEFPACSSQERRVD